MILDTKDGWLLSGQAANGTGSARDTRNAANYAYMYYSAGGNSAIFDLRASHDAVNWVTVASYTATAGTVAAAALAAYYPFVQVNARSIFSAAGGSAVLSVYYAPGYK